MNLVDKFKRMEKYTRYSIITIIIFSIITLFLTSLHHVSGDGCWHIPVGKFIAKNLKFPLFEPLGRDEPFWSPPLYHIIVAFVYYIFSIFSDNAANFSVKFIPAIFGILSLIFSFLIIKKLINSKIAFYSTVFLAFIPIFIDYSILSYVESILTFFVILSVYFLINGRFVLAVISAGLSILTKYNGVFILPVLVYILYKKFDKKTFYKNAIIITILPLLIALPWFIRNWLVLGNPIWPFLNFIFKGFETKSYTLFEFSRLFHYDIIAFTYLGFFGVPDGNYALLTFFDIPYLKFLLSIWLIGTLIFIAPLILGFFNNKNMIFILWVSSYLVLFLLYVANVGFSVSRMLLPAFPAIAVFWAFGYDKIMKNYKFKKLTNLLLVLIITGFVFTEFVKIKLASDAWDFYREDFDWVKKKTNVNAIFIANGQCVPYNIERPSMYATNENIGEADYIWINQNFKLDRVSILDDATLKSIQSKNYKVVYSNKKTGTIVYSTRQ